MRTPAIILTVILLCSCSGAGVTRYTLSVTEDFPHDETAYTQGLFFHEGRLFESTGLNGASSFREVDLATGVPSRRIDFPKEYFVEGSVFFRDSLYILTWQNEVAFKYDLGTLKRSSAWSYQREGWGLTTDGERLIASDGSANLYFMDANFRQTGRVTVRKDGVPVRWLNELEWIDGKVWANVYTTDEIMIIDPVSGNVDAVVDCRGLLPVWLRKPGTDVLNGIAYDSGTGRVFLTGKNWPRIYGIKLVKSRK